jgi:FkbM family methyltransferase
MILRVLKTIYNHPFNKDNKLQGVFNFLKWQINCRLNPFPILYQFTENTRLIVKKGLTGATGNLYNGLTEYEDMAFLLHFLREDDVFFDIGANVGVFTILASGEVGANSVTAEPVPQTFKILSDNIKINNLNDRVTLLNIGLGNDTGIIKFTRSLDTVNHVATENEKDTIDVPVKKLDEISPLVPILIKIDVEGYETEVLKGAKSILSSPLLKAIIIELNGNGKRYGFDERLIHEDLLRLGFRPAKYNPDNRSLIFMENFGSHNTIYIRDEAFAKERLSNARKVKVSNRMI